jgi:hypothetical protein
MKMSARGDLISQREFGRRHHLSQTRVRALVAAGLPLKNGKVQAARATAWLQTNVDPARRDHWNGNGADASLNELRRQREALKIEVGRLELEKAKGDIVDRAAVRKFIAGRAQMERDEWTAWVSAASARLAATLGVDTAKVFTVLETEVREQLRRLASKALDHDELA